MSTDSGKVRGELERLLGEADAVGDDPKAQRVWASQVRRLLDVFLGPGPNNIHSEAFYEFDRADSHAEKTGILRCILLSTPSAGRADDTSGATQAHPSETGSVKPLLFASYARDDYPLANRIVDAVRREGVDVWMNVDDLKPGEDFLAQTSSALQAAAGLLLFISKASMESAWVEAEVQCFVQESLPRERGAVIPVLLEPIADIPPRFSMIHGLRGIQIGEGRPSDIEQAARLISRAAAKMRPAPREEPSACLLDRHLADSLAGDARRQAAPNATEPKEPPRSVFVVHGHDDRSLAEVEGYLKELGVDAVVLRRIGGPAQSLFQKFMQWGQETRFALVLLSADDMGSSRRQYEAPEVGDRSLQFRARQNVILELGFFYGFLGWENVFVLYCPPGKVFPNFERPSDMDGVVFDHVDESGQWRGYLRAKLRERGFALVEKPEKGTQPMRDDARA